MSVIKIGVDKPVQKFEIGGKVYEVFYDDESLKKYSKQAQKFHADVKKAEKIKVDKLTEKQKEKVEAEYRQAAKKLIEMFFGRGTFEDIYDACGKATVNLAVVVEAVLDWLGEKLSSIKNTKKQYYTKK